MPATQYTYPKIVSHSKIQKIIKMNNKLKPSKTSFDTKKSRKGEWIEEKVRRMVNNGEPLTDGADGEYSQREEGVIAGSDPRTDKWNIAEEAAGQATSNSLKQREMRLGERTFDTMTPEQQKEFNLKHPKNKHAGKQPGEKKGGA